MSICHFVFKLCRNGYGDDIQFYRRITFEITNHYQGFTAHYYGNDMRWVGGRRERLNSSAPYRHEHELSVPD